MERNEELNFTLSIDSVKELPFQKYMKDFTFIVNNQEFKTSRYVADLISPIIRNYHSVDETIGSYVITTIKTSENLDFSTVLSLVSFSPQKLNEETSEFFREIFLKLGNKKEYLKLMPSYSEEITIDNVFDRIDSKQKYYDKIDNELQKVTQDHESIYDEKILDEEVDFISSHFFEIDQNKVKNLDLNIIEKVLQNDNLQIEDEDYLLNFILDIYAENESYSPLFGYVYFMNISNEKLEEFFTKFDLNDLDHEIWKSIIERVLNSQVNFDKYNEYIGKRKYTKRTLKYEKGKEYNGIIKYLTNKTGGNIHKNGTIEVTCNRSTSNDVPSNLLDFDEENHYQATGSYDIWICFDFKDMKVNISNYSIHTISPNSSHHLKSWVIEISNDKNTWTSIDEHSDCDELNNDNITATFDVKKNEFARYVRLRQTSEPWGGNYLWFNCMEFYGYLQE